MLARVLARIFRSVFLVRRAEAHARARLAAAMGLATTAELRELDARVERLAGRAHARTTAERK